MLGGSAYEVRRLHVEFVMLLGLMGLAFVVFLIAISVG